MKPNSVKEARYNLAWSWKSTWNHHVSGAGCWCAPLPSEFYGLVHRNYEWRDGEWHALREPQQ